MNLFNKNLDYNYKNNIDEVYSDDEEVKEKKKECKKKCKSKKMNNNTEFNSKDLMSEQIYSLSRTSQNRQKMNFKRNKKK